MTRTSGRWSMLFNWAGVSSNWKSIGLLRYCFLCMIVLLCHSCVCWGLQWCLRLPKDSPWGSNSCNYWWEFWFSFLFFKAAQATSISGSSLHGAFGSQLQKGRMTYKHAIPSFLFLASHILLEDCTLFYLWLSFWIKDFCLDKSPVDWSFRLHGRMQFVELWTLLFFAENPSRPLVAVHHWSWKHWRPKVVDEGHASGWAWWQGVCHCTCAFCSPKDHSLT